MHTTIISGILLMLVVTCMGTWHRSNFPDPQDVNRDECNRKGKPSWVCDPAQKLSFDEANQLDWIIYNIGNVTRCPCSQHVCDRDRQGYKIAVAIAPKILSDEEMREYAEDMPDYDKDYEPIKRLHHVQLFAYTLLKRWKVGKCGDGILIVYDPENFSLYTVGGKVALRKLKPGIIGDITMYNRDKFNDGPFQGIQKMLSDYRAVLLNQYNTPMYGHRPRTAAVIGNGGSSVTFSGLSLALIAAFTAVLW